MWIDELTFGAVPVGQHGACFDGVGDQALVAQGDVDHRGRLLEGSVGLCLVADLPVEGDVAGSVVVDLAGAFVGRSFGIGGCGQRFIVDRHQIDRVACDVAVGGDHHRYSVADVAHPLGGENRMGRSLELRQQPADRNHAGHAGGLDVLPGVDRHHAFLLERGRAVDRVDASVGVGAADHGGVQHAFELEVVGVLSAAADQGRGLRGV